MNIILVLVVGVLMLISFKMGKGQDIEVHPLQDISKKITEHTANKELKKQRDKQEEMLKKIDDYDAK